MSIAKPTIYPTLVIGLGGVGTNVARNVKKRFLRTWDAQEMRDLPSVLQVLAVDTEPLVNPPGEEPLYYHEFAFMGKFDATKLIDNKDQHPEINAWWKWSKEDLPLGYIHTGAKQMRPIGRLAFFRNYTVFKTRLIDKLHAMQENAAIKEAQERGFAVAPDYRLIYIVTSLCGGTGAGMFLDVAHRVRHEVGSNANIVGIFLLPSIFEKTIPSDLQRRRIRANTYAALKELDHFHRRTDFSAVYPGEQGPIPATPYRALNQIFLIERTNTDGRTLTTKADVERMVAHFIGLNAFSQLNKRILGLDVNITEEHEHGMAYSSFGVSALVLPRTAMRRYCTRRLVAEMMPLVGLGIEGPAAAERMARDAHGTLVSHVRNIFTELTASDAAINQLEQDLNKNEGGWLKFSSSIDGAAYSLFKQAGVRAACRCLERLAIPRGDGRLEKSDLAHEDTFPFKKTSNQPKPSWQMLLAGQEEIKKNEQINRDLRLFERRMKLWWAMVDKANAYAGRLSTSLSGFLTALEKAYGESKLDYKAIGREINPIRGGDDPETTTYYDLESGAVGEGELEEYWRRIKGLLNGPMARSTESAGSAPPRIAILLDVVKSALLARGPYALAALSPAEIRSIIEGQLTKNPAFESLENDELNAFDLRTVVSIQFNEELRPANYRVDSLIQPSGPHAVVDSDRRAHSVADEEHIKLMGTKEERNKAASLESRDFQKAFDGYRDFDWVPTGDGDRIDVCHVVHGLPLSHLASIPEMERQYAGWAKRHTLHVQPEWNDFEEVFIDPKAARSGRKEGSGEQSATTQEVSSASAMREFPSASAGATSDANVPPPVGKTPGDRGKPPAKPGL